MPASTQPPQRSHPHRPWRCGACCVEAPCSAAGDPHRLPHATALRPRPPGSRAASSSVERRDTTLVAGITKSPVTEYLWRMRKEAAEEQGQDSPTLESPEFLLDKDPADARVAVTLPFTTDAGTPCPNPFVFVPCPVPSVPPAPASAPCPALTPAAYPQTCGKSTPTPGATFAWACCWKTSTPWPAPSRSATAMTATPPPARCCS